MNKSKLKSLLPIFILKFLPTNTLLNIKPSTTPIEKNVIAHKSKRIINQLCPKSEKKGGIK
jgi:hypothetical protein